jgi:hypothetical protein
MLFRLSLWAGAIACTAIVFAIDTPNSEAEYRAILAARAARIAGAQARPIDYDTGLPVYIDCTTKEIGQ